VARIARVPRRNVEGLPAFAQPMRPALLVASLVGLAALALMLLLALPAHAEAGLEAPQLLQDHAPIRIDSDGDFDAAHGVRAGSGTANDPYLISNWRIRSDIVHIRIANTTSWFVVRNNDLEGTCEGEPLNCTLEAGIHIINNAHATVLHNRVAKMERAGITVWGAQAPVVDDNLVLGGATVPWAPPPSPPGGIGILVLDGNGAEVRGNRILDAGSPVPGLTAGLRIMFSNDTLVEGNEIRGSPEFGLSLVGVRRALIQDNVIADNGNGTAWEGFDGVMRYNNITGNTLYGLLVASANAFVTLEHNDFSRNGGGLEVRGPANTTMRANVFEAERDFGLSLSRNGYADALDNWWGSADGPDVNHTGPGNGSLVALLNGARPEQAAIEPWLGQRPLAAGAHAPRAGSTVSAVAAPPLPGDPTPRAALDGPGLLHPAEAGSFSAARSSDPNGWPMSFRWTFGDASPAVEGLRASHAYDAPGEYVVELTATNNASLSSTARVAVRVERAPLGVALEAPPLAQRGDNVTVSARAGGQPQGPVTFRFTTRGPGTFEGEGSAANTTTVRFDDPGEYFVGVEARAGDERAVEFQRVSVPNRLPVPRPSVEPAQGDTSTEFRFSAASSTDPDGDPLTFAWDFGPGETASGAEATHRFRAAGPHLVVLTANDGFSSASANLTVDVQAAGVVTEPPPKPTPAAPSALAALGIAGAARVVRGRVRPRR
jgi:PKD repeat protein